MELEKRPALKKSQVCPECGSSNTLYRQRVNSFVCRKCGNIFKCVNKKVKKGA